MMGHNMAIWLCEGKGGGDLQRGNEQEKASEAVACLLWL